MFLNISDLFSAEYINQRMECYNQMEPLRRIGCFPNTTYEAVYATATPGAEKFDPKWFEKWYEEEGGREYLMYDPRNEDDRMKIADWNGWGQTWKDFVTESQRLWKVCEMGHI